MRWRHLSAALDAMARVSGEVQVQFIPVWAEACRVEVYPYHRAEVPGEGMLSWSVMVSTHAAADVRRDVRAEATARGLRVMLIGWEGVEP